MLSVINKEESYGTGFLAITLAQVEMSGFEPESERLDPRISTSVAGCSFSPEVPQQAKENFPPAAETRKSRLGTLSSIECGTLPF